MVHRSQCDLEMTESPQAFGEREEADSLNAPDSLLLENIAKTA